MDYGYGMKLKRLQEEYVKAGKKGHGIFPACHLGGEAFLENPGRKMDGICTAVENQKRDEHNKM